MQRPFHVARLYSLVILIGLLSPLAARAQSSLKIYSLDVGQGDATLVIAPNKTAMLVDAAKTGMGSSGTPTTILAFINGKISSGEITNFKYVLSTHYDSDHIGGMGGSDGVINHVTDPPEIAYDRGGSSGTEQYTAYIDAIAEKSVTRQTITIGEVITLDSSAGVTARCIAVNGQVLGHGTIPGATDENERCIILLLTYGGFDYLFEGDATGGTVSGESDIETPASEAIKNSLQRGVDIVQASHHGSHTGSNTTFLTTIRPENVVISVGNTNPFGHPRQDALNRMESFPRQLPDRPDLRPADGTGVLNIFQTSEGLGGTSPSVKTAGTTDTEGILITSANGINYTVQSFNGTSIPATSFIADDVAAANDIDGDGLRDTTEDKNGDGIVNGDTNGNGIVDVGETFTESNPRTGDTDADGISDGVEDCGSDGVPNILEPGFNPATNPDPNGDDYNRITNPTGTEGNGVVDGPGERTSSIDADSDGDGLKDGQEDTNANGSLDTGETDPTDPDSDGDGVSDGPLDPDGAGPIVAGPDAFPLDPDEQWDTDRDGIGNNTDTDDDNDGILDIYETDTGVYVSPTDTGTDPLLADTDGDGALDGFEVDNGFDPNDANSYPKVVINEVLWNPDGEDDGKEYIELYNPQKSAIDVSNFIIQCGYTTTFYDNVFIPENTVIPSNGYYLIAESSAVTDINGYPADLIADLELQNAGDGNADGVRLLSPTKATVFDCILYGSAVVTLPTAGAATDQIPMEALISRVVPGVDKDTCRDFRNAPTGSPTSSRSNPRFPGVNVKVNEVCFDPPGEDSSLNLEFLELFNPDNRTVDIGGFRIQYAGGSWANNGSAIPAGTLMAPRSYFLIGQSDVSPTPDLVGLTTDLNNGDYYYYLSGAWHFYEAPTRGVRLVLPDNEKGVVAALDTLLYDWDSSGNPNSLRKDSLYPDTGAVGVQADVVEDRADQDYADQDWIMRRSSDGVDTNLASDWTTLGYRANTNRKFTDVDGDGIPDIYEPEGNPDGDYMENADDPDSDGDTIPDGVEDANQNGTYEPDGINSAGSAFYTAYHTPKETNAYAADTDGDGLRDDFEIDGGLDPRDDGTLGESAPGLKDGPNGASADPDGDGLTNLQEYLGKDGVAPALGTYSFATDSTDPVNPDSDGDEMPDGWEVANDLNPLSAADASLDPDGDGLTNLAEYVNGSEIGDADTDGDGMNDGWEVARSLDPLSGSGNNGASGDPDGDGLTNYQEYLGRDGNPPGGTDDSTKPLSADTDGDGLTDGVETHTHTYVSPTDTGTDPNVADTDADGMPDGWEVSVSLNPTSAAGSNGASGDPDADSLTNINEYNGGNNSTDPHNPDSDYDGMTDGWEYAYGLDPNDAEGANGPDGDPDGDGLKNLVEFRFLANPFSADTDGDGLTDYDEVVKYGSSPTSASSPAYAQAGEVRINEYFAYPADGQAASDADGNGVGSSDADEFVEFVNLSSHAVRLGGYRFTVDTSPVWATYDLEFPSGTVLAAGEVLVVFDDSAVPTGTFGYAQVVKTDNDLSLANSGSTIRLWGSSGSIVVDTYTYPTAPSGKSMVLTPEPNLTHTFAAHPLLSGKYFSPGRKMAGGAFNDFDGDGQPNSVDTDDDADGFSDIEEIYFETDPLDHDATPLDADGDGMPDDWEIANGLNPRDDADASLDPDGDGLTNLAEFLNGTSINDADTDDDGMNDGWEVARSLDPLSAAGANGASGDPDGDGLTNYQEYVGRDTIPPVVGGFDDSTKPLVADTDGDGLTDGVETHTHVYVSPTDTGTDPNVADTDGDGMPDGWEVAEALSPVSAAGNDGASGDPDADSLTNINEYNGGNNSTDPHNPDSDYDGMTDGWEYAYGLDPNDAEGANGPDGDPDGDGLKNLVEFRFLANPFSADTDGDGLTDYDEVVKYGSSPTSASSPAYAQAGEVRINEYFAYPADGQAASDADGNGVGSSDADEFVEFVNLSSHAVRLGGYRFTVDTSPVWATYDLEFPSGTVLAAGEVLVVFDDSAVPTGTFGYAQVIKTSNDLSCVNGGSTIKLWGGSNGSIVVDTYTYGSATLGKSGVLTPELNLTHTFATHPLLSGKYFSPGRKMAGGAFNDLDGDGQPNSVDTDDDGDGISDIWEIYLGSDPRDAGDIPPDSDGDGLSDGDLGNSEDWMDDDDDNDRVSDYDEINYDGNAGYNPYDPVNNPTGTDMDKNKADTDGDGYSDFMEFMFNGNPIDPNVAPSGPIRVNFQPASSDDAASFAWDTGQAFSPAINYGWVAGP